MSGATGRTERGGITSFLFTMQIKSSDLVKLGAIAAETYNEKDLAQTALEEAFGLPFTAARDNLLRDLEIAEAQGADMSIFAGDESRFRFPAQNTHIIVRISRVPTPHAKLEKLAAKVSKLEQELKLAKLALKHTAEQLVASHECDEVTDKVTLAFTRLRKS